MTPAPAPAAPAPAGIPAPAPAPAAPALTAERIVVQRDKISIMVVLAPGTPRYTTPALAAALAARVPTLPQHACVNANGPTFGHIMGHTPIPHVLEHLIIDAQCDHSSAAHADFLYVGTTEWVDEAAGRACVELNYTDDLDTLRALRDALAILNELLQTSW